MASFEKQKKFCFSKEILRSKIYFKGLMIKGILWQDRIIKGKFKILVQKILIKEMSLAAQSVLVIVLV